MAGALLPTCVRYTPGYLNLRMQPDRAIQRIHAAANMLVRLGDIGRPSRVEAQRELSVPGAPYVIAYRVEGDAYDILAVYHTSQLR